MAVYDILPSTNLKAEDIRDTLNANGGSVGNDCLTFFTAAAKINMWSKHKPVKVAKTEGLTDDEFRAVAYGLSYTTSSGYYVRWNYILPSGGEKTPYRLSDFRKYNPTIKSGLQFTQDSYAKDLVKDTTGLIIGLYTDSSMITLKDFSTTLFSGCQVRISVSSYDNTTTYVYYSEYENLAESSLQWTIPRSALVSLNVGKAAIIVEVKKTDGLIVSPLIKDMTFLTITANTGVSIQSWGTSMRVGTSTNNMFPASAYQPGGGYQTLNLTGGSNIIFSFGALKNDSEQTISSSNMYVLITYRDSNGNDVQKRVNLYKGSSLQPFSLSPGGVAADFFGIRHENMPLLSNGTAVSYAVQAHLLFNGIYGYYTITNTVRMLTKNP